MEIPQDDSSVLPRASLAREKWLLGFALVLTVALWSGVVWFAADYLGCRGEEHVLPDLSVAMEMSDAVVEGEATFLRAVQPDHCVDLEIYAIEIDSVHFVADETISDTPESRYQVPHLEVGDAIEVTLGLLGDGSETTPALGARRMTFVLGYDGDGFTPELPEWEAIVVADEDQIQQWWLDRDWVAMDVGPPTAESLAAWLEEIHTVDAGGAPGPFEDSYAFSQRPPSRAEQWLQTDPRARDLTPEDVPAEFRDEFVDVMIFVDLPKDLRGSDDRVVSVRSPSGIVLQVSIGAGSGALPALAKPGEAWEVVEIDGAGLDGSPVGDIPETVWSSGDAVLLTVEKRDGRLHATATPIDSAELTARMDAAADSS